MASKSISQEELINQTYIKLLESEIKVSRSVVELVVRGYVETKVNYLKEGSSVEEQGIGTTTPTWRRISKAFNPKEKFTPKIIVGLDPAMKSYMQDQLRTSPEFRAAVGAEEL